MNRPEVALLRKRPETCYNRIEGEALPGGSNFRVRLDRAGGCGTEQGVEQAAISEVDLRGLDLPLADVLVPGGELPDHVGSGQQVEVALHGGVRNTERSREFGSIPNLPMVVSELRLQVLQERDEPQGGDGVRLPARGLQVQRPELRPLT